MKFLIVTGFIFFIGAIILITNNFNKLEIERNGKVVSMQIESLPASCIGAKVRYFISFRYKEVIYTKATRGDFCEKHHIGELMDMKLLDGENEILFPNESALYNLVSFGVLGLFGLLLSIFQIIKLRKLNKY